MATYVTLTVPAKDIIGALYDEKRTSAYIEADTPHSLIIVDGSNLRVGGRRERVVGGTVTFSNLVATNSADNPTSFGYRITLVFTPLGSKSQQSITTSSFPLTANANLAAIEEAWDDITSPPSWRSDFMDSVVALGTSAAASATSAAASAAIAAEIAGASTADVLITYLDSQPTSDFRVQQDARQAAATDAQIAAAQIEAAAGSGVLGWQARNANGLPALDATAATDRATAATAELARYSGQVAKVRTDFTVRTGYTAVPNETSMGFTGGVFKSEWDTGEGTPSLDGAVTVLRTDTFRVVGRITVGAAAAATNTALWAAVMVSHKPTMNTAAYTDRLGVGVNELNQPIIFSALGMTSTDAVQSATPLPAGTYTATIVVDEERLSMSLTNDAKTIEYRQHVDRDVLTDGTNTGVVNWISLVNRDSRKTTGVSIDSVYAATDAVRTSTEAGAGKWELVYTYPDNTNPDTLRVDVPPAYDPRVPTPLVLFCHGSGRDALDPGNANTWDILRGLVSAGYLVATPNMTGSQPWGNAASVSDVLDAYTYMKNHYHLGPVLMLSASAGTLTALTSIGNRSLPGVVGLYAMYGVTNLRYQYDNNPTHTASIETAFSFTGSGNFNTATSGYDPNVRPGWTYRGIPMRFSASYADVTVDAVNNSDLFAVKVQPYAPEASVVHSSGVHGAAPQTDLADILAFFARCLNRK